MAIFLSLAGCGGGGSGSSTTSSTTTTTTAAASNVLAVTVGTGPAGNYANLVLTSVTICVPGSTTCQTIPNVMVDTGSSGLRLLASQVSISLPGVASPAGVYGECADFADGVTWGTVVQADVQLSGEKASSVPLQLINDNGVGPSIPATCTAQGAPENSQASLGVNGILGVGILLQDCGVYCVSTADAIYYDCPTSGVCSTESTIALASQVSNPAAAFPQDNNGVILQLAAIPYTGATTSTGSLIFGIGTESNNSLSATIIPVPSTGYTAGYFTATYNGTSYPNSFMDSGSSGLFFGESDALTPCPSGSTGVGYYCPGSAASLSLATLSVGIVGSSGSGVTASVNVANATYLFNTATTANAFNDLAGPAGDSLPGAFDFGVPFFFGKSVYTAFAGRATTSGTGPFFAFQ